MADKKDFGKAFETLVQGLEAVFGEEDGRCKKCGLREVPTTVFSCTCGQKIPFCMVCKTPEILVEVIKTHLENCTAAHDKLAERSIGSFLTD